LLILPFEKTTNALNLLLEEPYIALVEVSGDLDPLAKVFRYFDLFNDFLFHFVFYGLGILFFVKKFFAYLLVGNVLHIYSG
jgi:hypothetical protein